MSKSTVIWLTLNVFAALYFITYANTGDSSYFLSANIFIAVSLLCLSGEIK